VSRAWSTPTITRVERVRFDLAVTPVEGAWCPAATRPGFDVELKSAAAEALAA
jgi:hypothetical protein